MPTSRNKTPLSRLDIVIFAEQKLAALQDLLDAWKGLGSSITSIWRGRHLGLGVQARLAVIFLFFAASSTLQIIVPATITAQTTNSTLSVAVDAVRLYAVTDSDLTSINEDWYTQGYITSLGTLPYAMEEQASYVSVPPGVQQK